MIPTGRPPSSSKNTAKKNIHTNLKLDRTPVATISKPLKIYAPEGDATISST
jgi:hypothetical protein